jgi:sterol desaturase/sphingolipid hydroxylase (fatty acid hydroxylase superfamily)
LIAIFLAMTTLLDLGAQRSLGPASRQALSARRICVESGAVETSSYYALGIPLFVVLLAIERAILARRRARLDLADTVSNLGCGLGQVVFGVFSGPIVLLLYRAFGARLAVVSWPRDGIAAIAPWVIAFAGVDLCYYAMHRANHRMRALWLTHVVHHQSERFDLSVALRQTWLSDFVALLFYWPLPLLGVGEVPFFAAVAVLSVYQVTLHTELVGRPRTRLGRAWALVFNTPSHHRVHHARISRGRGANFGATLIVWDRLLGTFEAEKGPVSYGVTPALGSFDPVWAQIAPLARALGDAPPGARRAPSRAGLAIAVALLLAVGAGAGGALPATLGDDLAVRAPIALALFVALAVMGALLDGVLLGKRPASSLADSRGMRRAQGQGAKSQLGPVRPT